VLALAFRYFRHPVKLALIGTIAIALLAARGLDRAASQRRSPVHAVAGLCAALVLAFLARWPELPARLLAEPLPELRDERSLVVAREQWPRAFISSAALGAGASLALAAGSRLAPIAGLLAALDVLAVNTTLNPTTAASFYEPRPELQALLDKAKPAGPERWFSFGASNTAALGWSPDVLRLNSKVWYYYMNRQWLLPRSHILHGLDAAFDLERAGWEPQGATLAREERNPIYYPQLHRWLRLGNVRWVLAGAELPRALVEERGRASFPEIAAPLRLYEVRDPLPRAFWVPRAEGVRDAAAALERMFRDDFDPRRLLVLEGEPGGPDAAAPDGAAGSVRFEAVGPHGRRLHVAAPPGWVLVLEGFHPAWRAVGPQGPIQLRRGDGRYLAFRTPGGEQAVELRYAPAWRGPALVLGALGLTLVALVLARPTLSLDRGEGGALASPD
jgi:hypothetical protein